MKDLINISGQQFYYSTIDQVIDRSSQDEKFAVIIDGTYLKEFLTKGGNIITEASQIIIISENVDSALVQFEEVNVLLIAANNFKEAVKIATLGSALSKKVICIPKEDENMASSIMEEIMA